jgi:hypothetical protein
MADAAAMTAALVLLIIVAVLLLAWSAARGAAEEARRHARDICSRHRVQLLDQSVALRQVRLRRGEDGRMRLQRTYEFAYSAHGDDRQLGRLALLGTQLLWTDEPEPR